MNAVKAFFIKLFMPKALKEKLEGNKTAIGVVLATAGIVLMAFGVDVPNEFWGTVAAITGIGVADKIRRMQPAVKEFKESFEKMTEELEKTLKDK